MLRNKSINSFLAFLCLLLYGCSTTQDPTRSTLGDAEKNAAGKPDNLKPFYQRLYWEGESNGTLNRMRLASAAMQQGEWKHAEQALDEIIPYIEALGPADARSQEAKDDFTSEGIKKFKGEAYERSMVYFLRGLLFMRNEDWSNARACFKSVQIQDAAKVDPKLRENWASADWLEGWCNFNLGETSAAQECWERAKKHRSSISIPQVSTPPQVVCVALIGFGPIKVGKGKFGEELTFREGESRTSTVQLKDSKKLSVMENLFDQANSRGQREMDKTNIGKAETREAASTAGDVLIVGGTGTTIGGAVKKDTTVAAAGLGAAAAGMITKGVASGISPQADTRAWDLLPATIQGISIDTQQDLQFQFLNAQRKVIKEETIPFSEYSKSKFILLIER